MKIIYFVKSLHEAGTSVQAITTCEFLKSHGHNVELVVALPGGVFMSRAIAKGVSVTPLAGHSSYSAAHTVLALTKYLKDIPEPIPLSGAKRINLLAIAAHRLSGCHGKLVLTLTNDLSQKKSFDCRGRWVFKLFQTKVYKLADHLIVLTEGMRSELQLAGFSQDKVSVIPPAIDYDHVIKEASDPVDHSWLEQPKGQRDVPVLLTIGRLVKQKNQIHLIEAFARLVKSRPARLMIMGTGSEKMKSRLLERCRSLGISDQVEFIGFQSNPYKFINQCDMFVLSSLWEGFGIVVAEALMCGTPVVSTDCPHGPRDILKNQPSALLVPLFDEEAFAEAMERSLKMHFGRYLIGSLSPEYGIDRVMQKYLSLMNDMKVDETVLEKTPAFV